MISTEPVIQASLFVCDLVLCVLVLTLSQMGLEKNSRPSLFLIDTRVSREVLPVLLRTRIWGTNILTALTSQDPQATSHCQVSLLLEMACPAPYKGLSALSG